MQNVTEGETEAREDEVVLLNTAELFGEERELTPSSAMWLGALSCLRMPPCPFLRAETQSDDRSLPVTLSLFLSSPDLHIAK